MPDAVAPKSLTPSAISGLRVPRLPFGSQVQEPLACLAAPARVAWSFPKQNSALKAPASRARRRGGPFGTPRCRSSSARTTPAPRPFCASASPPAPGSCAAPRRPWLHRRGSPPRAPQHAARTMPEIPQPSFSWVEELPRCWNRRCPAQQANVPWRSRRAERAAAASCRTRGGRRGASAPRAPATPTAPRAHLYCAVPSVLKHGTIAPVLGAPRGKNHRMPPPLQPWPFSSCAEAVGSGPHLLQALPAPIGLCPCAGYAWRPKTRLFAL